MVARYDCHPHLLAGSQQIRLTDVAGTCCAEAPFFVYKEQGHIATWQVMLTLCAIRDDYNTDLLAVSTYRQNLRITRSGRDNPFSRKDSEHLPLRASL